MQDVRSNFGIRAMLCQNCAAWFSAIVAFVSFCLAYSGHRQDRADRRRSQASKISAWVLVKEKQRENDIIVVSNQSGMPVYDAIVTFTIKDYDGRNSPKGASGYRHKLRTLPPGNWQFLAPEGWRGMSAYPGVELAFTDASNRHWLRTSRGYLKPLRCSDPIKYYGIILPYTSARLKSIDLTA